MFTVYYYGENQRYQQLYQKTLGDLKAVSIQVNILINYGNGTKEWHNNTRVPIGYSVFNVTRMIAEVNYKLEEWGVFVTAINGVGGTGSYWNWWYWNATSSMWQYGPIGCGAFILHEGDLVGWIYTSDSSRSPA
jgi:hypothetical protein